MPSLAGGAPSNRRRPATTLYESLLCYMKLPHQIQASQYFVFETADELISALGSYISQSERQKIKELSALGLPPVTSLYSLATMLGVNTGLIWSIINNKQRFYNKFIIKKGDHVREIAAPRVVLKIIQKWLAHHWMNNARLPAHVYGFVPGRSHIQAAFEHRYASWVFSADIRQFFPSTSQNLVQKALQELGYDSDSATLLANLTCLQDRLVQGAPTSPVLSNLCFLDADLGLFELGKKYGCTLTRYADDIVFSGSGKCPVQIREDIECYFQTLPWKLARDKFYTGPVNGRNKVHGLIVGDGSIRLTKGYRNKIRAYQHVLERGVSPGDFRRLSGHLNFEKQVCEHVRKHSEGVN